MMLKIKRFQHIEDLLAEAVKIVQDQSNKIDVDHLDDLLDKLVEIGIDDIQASLAQPENQIFASKDSLPIINGYLSYCKQKSDDYSSLLRQELSQETPLIPIVNALQAKLIQLSERILVIEQIYQKLTEVQPDESYQKSLELAEEVKKLIQDSYLSQYSDLAEKIKGKIAEINRATSQETKVNLTEEFMKLLDSLKEAIRGYPQEYQEAIETNAIEPATQIVKNEVGEEQFNDVQTGSRLNKEETDVVRRILDLQNINFQNEATIKKEISNIRIKINSLREHTNVKRKASSEETIVYLENMLNDAEEWLLKNAAEKSIDLSSMKGIHYDFNKRLKLYEVTDLPVTGQQIADASIIMKMRKGLASMLQMLFPGKVELTAAGQAFADVGLMTHNIYATVLNKSAKTIGRLLKGREGEIKGDAISRMFIPDTSYLDKKGKTAVNEEGVAPGVSPQVPGSIGGMGPIQPPTPTSLGSGDNFSPTRKKKGKKDKRILEFSEFINQNNLK